jgi:hypothetical protein
MTPRRFDDLVRAAGSRRAIATVIASALAGAGLSTLGMSDAGAACKRVGGRCKKGKKRAKCCGGSTCKQGRCRCAAGRLDCDGDGRCETDVRNDPENCGGCGVVCPPNTSCAEGRCAICLGDRCGDLCTNLQTDDENCGACGNRCANDESCLGGTCIPTEI